MQGGDELAFKCEGADYVGTRAAVSSDAVIAWGGMLVLAASTNYYAIASDIT